MPYYNRGYGGGLPTAGPNVKRFIVGTYSALADTATGNIAMNLPIDAAAGRMIQLWSVEIELSTYDWADTKFVAITLARTAGTAERYTNDPDVIFKWKIGSNVAAAGQTFHQLVIDKDFYPAVPVMNNQIHVTITNQSGAALTVYVKIWYTDLFVNMAQSIALLQSQVI